MVELKHGDVVRFFAGCLELGEIYSLACDTNHIITGHTLTNSAFKIWRNDNFEVVKVIKVTHSPLALALLLGWFILDS